MELTLRKATVNDGELLLSWRNDPITRFNSFNSDPISRVSHFRWLEGVFANPLRDLYVAEVDGVPVGTLRVDRNDSGESELSWTVAPEARGHGIGKEILIEARRMIDGVLTAQIKVENVASIKIAEAAGFFCRKRENGVMNYCSLSKT